MVVVQQVESEVPRLYFRLRPKRKGSIWPVEWGPFHLSAQPQIFSSSHLSPWNILLLRISSYLALQSPIPWLWQSWKILDSGAQNASPQHSNLETKRIPRWSNPKLCHSLAHVGERRSVVSRDDNSYARSQKKGWVRQDQKSSSQCQRRKVRMDLDWYMLYRQEQ